MGGMTSSEFDDFYYAVHKTHPYPWQNRLAREVIDGNGWPDSINVPTGCGKTSCIDVAVYALACRPDSHPRRIVYIVNRRTVVDAGDERAAMIASRLESPAKGTILDKVSKKLHSLSVGTTALNHVVLRGGTFIEREWHNNPTQPCVISSTVDQAGSRLLFQGYGVGRISKYVEAGLLGSDCLWILDETHISKPFSELLKDVQGLRVLPWSKLPLRPWHIVEMTATPVRRSSNPFCLDAKDRSFPSIASKITAPKPCELFRSRAKDSGDYGVLAADMVDKAIEIKDKHGLVTVAVIVNRVATAKEVHRLLVKKKRAVHLIIGRMRPWDRDRVMRCLEGLKTGKGGTSSHDDGSARDGTNPSPDFVVSTQCLEVGVDLDFDGMVSEASSFDSLRQRFGRLNRAGAWPSPRGVIVAPKSVTSGMDDDPIYGTRTASTWRFLTDGEGVNEVDFGIERINNLIHSRGGANDLIAEDADGSSLLPAHMDLLCQTNPRLHVKPDISPFLHGFGRGIPYVSVAWRAGMSDSDAVQMLVDIPPLSAECMQVPLWDIRTFLKGKTDQHAGGGDAEWENYNGKVNAGADRGGGRPTLPRLAAVTTAPTIRTQPLASQDSDSSKQENAPFPLRWRGKDDIVKITNPDEIRPGDVIILPVESRGWSTLGHVPLPADLGTSVDSPVSIDIAETVAFKAYRRVRMRIGETFGWPGGDARLKPIVEDLVESTKLEQSNEVVGELKNRLIASLQAIKKGGEFFMEPEPSWSLDYHVKVTNAGNVLVTSAHSHVANKGDRCAYRLDTHLARTSNAVAGYANHLKLSTDMKNLLCMAAEVHDVGKADIRFQRMLYKNQYTKTLLLAKSVGTRSRAEDYLPKGYRHEFTSAAMASSLRTVDDDLFIHCIESHHGHCRPVVPIIFDDGGDSGEVEYHYGGVTLKADPVMGLEQVQSGAARRFWKCVRRYGWWGLAWLEAILILADWDASRGTE